MRSFQQVGPFRLFQASLFALVLFEVAFMGSGRLLQVGPLTVRMLLFALSLALAAVAAAVGARFAGRLWLLAGSFAALLAIGAVVGLSTGASLSAVGEDLKPLSYFFIAFYFVTAIDSLDRVRLAVRVIRAASILMALLYGVIIILIMSGYLDFSLFYAGIAYLGAEGDSGGDIFFRGTSGVFLYKGFVLMVVGAFFFLPARTWKSKLAFILLTFAIFATLTRGFMITFFLCLAIKWLVNREWLKLAGLFALAGVFTISAFPKLMQNVGDKTESDMVRIVTIGQVEDRLDPVALLIGHGFGHGVPERPIHMEIAPLEILHKQGILGLAWWAGFLLTIVQLYRRAREHSGPGLAESFLLASLAIVLVSLTNPFMNNPIGMSVLLISLASLDVLARNQVNFGMLRAPGGR